MALTKVSNSVIADNAISAAKLAASSVTKPKINYPGAILQVVQTTKLNVFSTTSTGYVDVTGFSVNITPQSVNSKIMVFAQVALGSGTVDRYSVFGRLTRNGTPVHIADADGSRDRGTISYQLGGFEGPMMQPIVYLDSPATTSVLTYQIQIRAENPQTAYINRGLEADGDSGITPRTSSSIVVMEVMG